MELMLFTASVGLSRGKKEHWCRDVVLDGWLFGALGVGWGRLHIHNWDNWVGRNVAGPLSKDQGVILTSRVSDGCNYFITVWTDSWASSKNFAMVASIILTHSSLCPFKHI